MWLFGVWTSEAIIIVAVEVGVLYDTGGFTKPEDVTE